MNWYFPTELNEVPSLLSSEGVVPHAGGTGLLRTGLRGIRGLVDLSALPLTDISQDGELISLGSCNTYSDVCRGMDRIDPGSILQKALCSSASTPLRNRITLGGSIASFPLWSDLLGPLIALGSEVTVFRDGEEQYPVQDIAGHREKLSGGIITGVRYNREWPLSWYHRQTRVAFDYPLFTITILLKTAGGKITDSRLVVTGTLNRYSRLSHVEERLTGQTLDSIDTGILLDGISPPLFPSGKPLSRERTESLFRTWLQRGIMEITGRSTS